MPMEICIACERFFELVGCAAGSLATAAGANSSLVTPLIVRATAETENDEAVARALDLVDQMVRFDALGADKALDVAER